LHGFFLGRDGSRFTSHRRVVLDSVAYSLESFADTSSPDVMVLCVKAYDLAVALTKIGESGLKPCPLILQGNGFVDRVVAEFRCAYPEWEVRFGLCTFGIKENGFGFEVVGAGACEFGPAPETLRRTNAITAAEQALAAATGAKWNANIVEAVRVKWLWNTVLNSLTAVFDLATNGKVVNHKDEARAAFVEAVTALKVLDPATEIDADQAWKDLWLLVERTKLNENSMHRDIRVGRKTESEYLAGAAGDKFPVLSSWHRKILELSEKARTAIA
jgi:ketopantoate reductase